MAIGLSWNEQTDRIRAGLGLEPGQPLPEVNVDALLIYRDHLHAMLGVASFEAEYCGECRDRVYVCGILDEVDPVWGVLCDLCGEVIQGEFPLCDVEASVNTPEREVIEDYKYWLREFRQS